MPRPTRLMAIPGQPPPITFTRKPVEPVAPPVPLTCQAAQEFDAWAATLITKAREAGSEGAFDRAVGLLTDGYFSRCATLPKRHLNTAGDHRRHGCLAAVFEDAYMQLRAQKLSLAPPSLLPSPVPAPIVVSPPPRPPWVEVYLGDQDPN